MKLPARYAESVAVYGMTPDGSSEVNFRLARFPQRGKGTLWMSVFVGGQYYSVVDTDIDLGPARHATPVRARQASFRVANTENIAVATIDRHTYQMRGGVKAQTLAHVSQHPPTGPGTIPISLELEFRAIHSGIRVRFGRLEIFGRIIARVTTPAGVFSINSMGKWHEQTGQRLTFAPRFNIFGGAEKILAYSHVGERAIIGAI